MSTGGESLASGHGLTTNYRSGPAITIPVAFSSVSRAVRSSTVSSPGPEYVYVNGSRSRRSCGSDEILWKPPGHNGFSRVDFQPAHNRPRSLGFEIILHSCRDLAPTPTYSFRSGNDASETGTFANFSSALQMTLPSSACLYTHCTCLIYYSDSRANYSIDWCVH